MKEDRATQVSAYDEWDAKLSALERAKQPWTQANIEQFNGLATILHSLPNPPASDPMWARNNQLLGRTERLLPVADDSEWLIASRACASAATLDDCEAVNDYSKKPKGRHLAEAKSMLDSPKYKALVKKAVDARTREMQEQADDLRQRCNVCVGQCLARGEHEWNCRSTCSSVCR